MAKKETKAKSKAKPQDEESTPAPKQKAEKDPVKAALAQDPLPKFVEDVSCVRGNQTIVKYAGEEVPNDYLLLKKLQEAGGRWE